ncbi:hypothetical protein [Nonomuraea sp. LPB2021202275-12-8]|uniref:hypothetical protein n=1 Tax=Nonomuraea sp. LPB2021202275-12-8 TaxID=3120159 RepID=UPI00300CBD99
MLRIARLFAAALLTATCLLGATAASASPLDVTCAPPSSETIVFNPPLTDSVPGPVAPADRPDKIISF